VTPAPENQRPVAAAGRGHLRASHADRDQTIDVLKAAFVQGRLTKDEFDARVAQTFTSRTYAELATVTADIPAGPAAGTLARPPSRRRMSNAARWGTSGAVTPALLAVAFGLQSLPSIAGYSAVAFVIAAVYFVFWLSTGTDMLWQWYCLSSPTAKMCVRCAHTIASHRTPDSCAVRISSLGLRGRCPCAGYVPPGVSPKKVGPAHLLDA
jgi:Domain of unknown function (DUF1707)